MKSLLNRTGWRDKGVLTFEWILLVTILTIGIIGGLSAIRDAIIIELGDVAQAMVVVDQSYLIGSPWDVSVGHCIRDGAVGAQYIDAAKIGEGPGNVGQLQSQSITGCDFIESVDFNPSIDSN